MAQHPFFLKWSKFFVTFMTRHPIGNIFVLTPCKAGLGPAAGAADLAPSDPFVDFSFPSYTRFCKKKAGRRAKKSSPTPMWGHRQPVTALALSASRPFGPAGFARGLDKQGHISVEITDLEFENHKNVKNCIFCTLEPAGTIMSNGIPKQF